MSSPWSTLTPIGLEKLNGLATLETRVDRKYIVSTEVIEDLVHDLGQNLRILEIEGLRRFAYETVYFDTVSFDSYLAAARSRPKRFKVRIRSYLDSQLCSLEVKTRDRNDRTVKHRRPYDFENRDRLTTSGQSFVEAIVGEEGAAGILRPVLMNHYTRRTLLIPDAVVRATIDSEYHCQALECSGRAALTGGIIVETKTTGKASLLDRLLWRAGYRPLRISKYCTGLAVARGGLPANKWQRTIVRHMTVEDLSGLARSLDLEPAQARAARSP